MSVTGTCEACGGAFTQNARGRRARFCKRAECVLARGGKAPAVNPQDRHRPPAVTGRVKPLLDDAGSRAVLGDERLFFTRLAAFKRALEAGDHPVSRDALLDLIAASACWAAVIDPDEEGEIPGPRWPSPARPPVVLSDVARPLVPMRTQPGANAVGEYVQALTARADDLDTEQALDRLERLLGLAA